MLRNKYKNKGLTLVELMMSILIMSITMPLMYNVLITIQRGDLTTKIDVELQTQSRLAMQNIFSDIRESRAIFDNSISGMSTLLPTTSGPFANFAPVTGTAFTTDSRDNAPPLTKSSAIALMKYTGKILVDPAVPTGPSASGYKMIIYYLRLNKDKDFTTVQGVPLRAIMKTISKETYFDPTFITIAEKTTLTTNNSSLIPVEWTPPLPHEGPALPTSKTFERFYKLTIDAAPGSVGTDTIRGIKVPPEGGLIFTRQNSRINITLVSVKKSMDHGIRSIILQSTIVARN